MEHGGVYPPPDFLPLHEDQQKPRDPVQRPVETPDVGQLLFQRGGRVGGPADRLGTRRRSREEWCHGIDTYAIPNPGTATGWTF